MAHNDLAARPAQAKYSYRVVEVLGINRDTRPTFLALITLMAGFTMGTSREIPAALFFNAVWGSFLIGAGANAWNQCLEREYDAKMKRTQDRPVVTGQISLTQGMIFASVCSVWGLIHLYLFVNILAAGVGLILWITYVMIYRPLKRTSPYCVYVGAISGALPPCLGWAAASNELSLGAWILFAILYCWQVPHFFAIAWVYRTDYLDAGFRMPTVEDNAKEKMRLPVVGYSLALVVFSLMPTVVGLTGFVYLVFSLILGLVFVIMAVRFLRDFSESSAVRLILTSVVYLCLLITVMVIDKI